MDGDVTLEGDANCHENRGAHNHTLGWIQKVGEEHCVDVSAKVETASETLQDRSKQVPAVEAQQADQQEVERIPHFVSANNKKYYKIHSLESLQHESQISCYKRCTITTMTTTCL